MRGFRGKGPVGGQGTGGRDAHRGGEGHGLSPGSTASAVAAEIEEEAGHQDGTQPIPWYNSPQDIVRRRPREGSVWRNVNVRDDDVVQEVGAGVRDIDDGDDVQDADAPGTMFEERNRD